MPAFRPQPIEWPPALTLPKGASQLSWDGDIAGATASLSGEPVAGTTPPVSRWRGHGRAVLQGIELELQLEFELDHLVAIELRGRLDGPALSALGATESTTDDLAHHTLACGETRIMIDALDGVIRLEPSLT